MTMSFLRKFPQAVLFLAAALTLAGQPASADPGLRPLAAAQETARGAGQRFRAQFGPDYHRAFIVVVAVSSMDRTLESPEFVILNGEIGKGLLVRFKPNGKDIETTLDLKTKYRLPISLYVPAACADMAKLAWQTASAFRVVGDVQSFSMGKANASAVIAPGGNLQCGVMRYSGGPLP